MARVDLTDSWTSPRAVSQVPADVETFLRQESMTMGSRTEHSVSATQGSQLRTRLLGGWFVPATWIPKRANVSVQSKQGGTEITATIEESLGLGYLDPMFKKKYASYFEEWMERLKSSTAR